MKKNVINKKKVIKLIKNTIELNSILYTPEFKECLKNAILPFKDITIESISFDNDVNVKYYNDHGEYANYRISFDTFYSFINIIEKYQK